jgi:hypothetical protein
LKNADRPGKYNVAGRNDLPAELAKPMMMGRMPLLRGIVATGGAIVADDISVYPLVVVAEEET